MKLETAILYFLAARYPASFGAETVRLRVNRSGAVDGEASADDVRKALALLEKRFGHVELSTVENVMAPVEDNACRIPTLAEELCSMNATTAPIA